MELLTAMSLHDFSPSFPHYLDQNQDTPQVPLQPCTSGELVHSLTACHKTGDPRSNKLQNLILLEVMVANFFILVQELVFLR